MTKEKNISTTKPTGLSPILDDSDKYRDADRIEEAGNIPLTPAQKNLVEHIEAGNRSKVLDWDELSNRGDSFSEYPTYIKHWETAKPWGWELRILTEDGLHILHLKWKTYRRAGLLTEEKGKKRPL